MTTPEQDDGKPYTIEQRREYYRNLPTANRLNLDMEGRPVYVWQQYPTEPDWAYRCFQEYLNLKQYRSVEQVAEFRALSPQHVKNTSRKYMWLERAKAWDQYQRDKFLADREAEIQAFNAKSLEVAKLTIDKVGQRIASLDPEEIAVRNIAPMMKEAVNIGRLALGMSTENIEEKQEQKVTIEYVANWRAPAIPVDAPDTDDPDLIEGEASEVLQLQEGTTQDGDD